MELTTPSSLEQDSPGFLPFMKIEKTPSVLSTSGNPIVFTLYVPAHTSTLTGFRLQAEINLVYQEKTFKLPLLNLHIGSNGRVSLDISRLLHDKMSINIPSTIKYAVSLSTSNKLQYKVIFRATWDDGYLTAESQTLEAFRATMPSTTQVLFLDYIRLGKNYLSFTPTRVDTISNALHYLHFLAIEANTYIVKINARYRSGRTRNIQAFTFQAQKYDVFVIPAGLKHIPFLDDYGDLFDYSVWIENTQGEIVGKKIYFEIKSQTLPSRCILFENMLGGIDAIVAYKQKDSLKIEREEYQIGSSILSDTTAISNSLEYTSGNITRAMAELYKDFLQSDRVWLVTENNCYPIVIEKGTFTIIDETSDLYAISFKLKHTAVSGIFRDYSIPIIERETAVLITRNEKPITTGDKQIEVQQYKKLEL